jgi:CheY-like chemotaxis protein
MYMPNDPELREKISKLSNEDLLKMVNVDFADYREEALQYAEVEMKVRGIPNENYKIRNENTPRTDVQISLPKMRISNEVIVTDIQMPFMSMVVFMVKWALASIPAFIILLIIAMIVIGVLGEIQTLFGPPLRR